MCGRFFVDAKNREIDRLLERLPENSPPVRLGEVFPSNHALVLAAKDGHPEPESMQWGFPRHDGKGLVINARAETALAKPMFRHSRPAAVPTNGFFEWKTRPGAKSKDKFLFHGPDGTLWLAALWDTFAANEMGQFTILTTAANESVRPWHERMPLLLEPGQLETWLTTKNITGLLARQHFPLSVELVQN